jgi:hypothetical protein
VTTPTERAKALGAAAFLAAKPKHALQSPEFCALKSETAKELVMAWHEGYEHVESVLHLKREKVE